MREINSLFFSRLQEDHINLCELISFTIPNGQIWRWVVSNETVVSSTFNYEPFPGQPNGGVEESVDLGVSVVDFTLVNSSNTFTALLQSQEMDNADINIRRVFIDTPDLGSMNVFDGKLAEFSHTRHVISGQARSRFGGRAPTWPYYTYMDTCTWKFGGAGCAFDTSTVTTSGTIWSGSGGIIVEVESGTFHVDSYSINQFEFGKFTFLNGANSGSIRSIFASSGDYMTMSHRLPLAISSGDTFSIYPGCKKRLVEDCTSLYNNSSNFLGFPWIPRQENAF